MKGSQPHFASSATSRIVLRSSFVPGKHIITQHYIHVSMHCAGITTGDFLVFLGDNCV